MRVLPFVVLTAFTIPASAQDSRSLFSITAGMGIDLQSASAISDYINVVALPTSSARVDEFATAIEFFVKPEAALFEEWSLALEYAFLIRSHVVESSGGTSSSEFTLVVHLPTVLVYSVTAGEAVSVKLGGGIGVARGIFSERLFGASSSTSFRTGGLSTKLEAVANMKLDDHFYGNIGLDLRFVFAGNFKVGSRNELWGGISEVSMSFVSVGLKLGVLFGS